MTKPMTREEWLNAMTDALRPKFKAAGYAIPKRVGVSCGWPSSGGLRKGASVEGECWSNAASEADCHEIFVSPRVSDSVRVAAILVHELIHTALPDNVNHGAPFVKAHRALGLIDRPKTSVPGSALKAELGVLIARFGEYPHSKIKASSRRTKPQTARLLKAVCPACGYTIRVTAKWVEVGLPTCPCGGQIEAAA